MKRKIKKRSIENCKELCKSSKGCGGCFYFLGFIGSAIFYIQQATGFWAGVLGLLKALVWPAFLVYELLKFIGV
jgi:hypothetical protein